MIDRGSDRHVLLKNNAQPEKRGVCVKNGNKGRDVLDDSRKRYHARGQREENISKYFVLRTNQITGFGTALAN